MTRGCAVRGPCKNVPFRSARQCISRPTVSHSAPARSCFMRWDLVASPTFKAKKRACWRAGSRRVRWYFAEPEAAEFARKLFGNPEGGRGRIEIVVLRYPGSDQ